MGEMKKDRMERLGTVLIYEGVGVWLVYVVVRFALGTEVTGRQFLPYHLAGVVPGALLRRHRFLRRLTKRLLGRSE
jgi:hypothetical protein